MINARQDRINYGEALKPPDGYRLDSAIGTTYSLDLQALLLIPIAISMARDMSVVSDSIDSDQDSGHESQLYLLRAHLDDTPKRIKIFHQAGKLKAPKKYSRLIAFWEKSIIAVKMPNQFSSFHPKVWIIRYINDRGGAVYRMIVTSRNITLSHDWDFAAALVGNIDNKGSQKSNKPLIDFLKYLNDHSQGEAVPNVFFKELPRVHFRPPKGFNELTFHPVNISTAYPTPTLEEARERLIVSPFLDKGALKKYIANTEKDLSLYSSQFELSKINEELLNKIENKYSFSEILERSDVTLEDNVESGDTNKKNSHLHAKIYITDARKKNKREIAWFIGSGNCTSMAIKQNIEFFIRLKTTLTRLSPKKIGEELKEYFEYFDEALCRKPEPSSDIDKILRTAIYNISSASIAGEIFKQNGVYSLTISIPPIIIPKEVSVSFRLPSQNKPPLPEKLQSQKKQNYSFTNLLEEDLTGFLIFDLKYNKVKEMSFMQKIQVDLPESRFNSITKSLIQNQESFFSLIYSILYDLPFKGQSVQRRTQNRRRSSQDQSLIQLGSQRAPLFESILIAAGTTPNKIRKICDIIRLTEENKWYSDSDKLINFLDTVNEATNEHGA